MKKIIIYGVGNAQLRARVVNYLSDKYEIVAVTDSFWNRDFLQGETFIKPCEISLCEYDYILILSEKKVIQDEIRDKLLEMNIRNESIIVPRLLMQKNVEFIPDLKKDILDKSKENKYEAVSMGLSYSLRGINFEELSLDCLDFSWHGLDLYYNYKLLESLPYKVEENIKTILCFFPFYYLNYDMSQSLYQFSTGQILACRGFKDWHNAEINPNREIREYIISQKMFGKKFWKYKKWKKYQGGGV